MQLVQSGSPLMVEKFDFQGLSNLSLAFATQKQQAPPGTPVRVELFREICLVALGATIQKQGFAQTAAHMVWAFSTVGVPAKSLFERIAAEAFDQLPTFSPSELALLANGLAAVSHALPCSACCEL